MKSVIFDLDNTLYSYDRAHAKAYAAVQRLASAELGLSPEEFDRRHKEACRILERRSRFGPVIHNRLIRFQVLLEQLGRPIGLAPALADCYWQTLLDAMEIEPGAAQTLQRLHDMGLSIGVGTNMTADWQLEKLKRLGLLSLVDFLVTSEEANAEKPDLRLFLLCAEKAGCELQACCFVGDNLEKDALAAQSAGMQGIWYCPDPNKAIPEKVPGIRSLSALPELLQDLAV